MKEKIIEKRNMILRVLVIVVENYIQTFIILQLIIIF